MMLVAAKYREFLAYEKRQNPEEEEEPEQNDDEFDDQQDQVRTFGSDFSKLK